MEASAEPNEPNERDNTDEWRLTPARSLVTVAELEGRIDLALATARSAEEAALEIGAASLEAAEQARHAAALAERASASAANAAEAARAASAPSPLGPPTAAPAANGIARRRPDPFEERITAFRLRAERVMIRLQKIEAGAPSREPTEVVRLG